MFRSGGINDFARSVRRAVIDDDPFHRMNRLRNDGRNRIPQVLLLVANRRDNDVTGRIHYEKSFVETDFEKPCRAGRE